MYETVVTKSLSVYTYWNLLLVKIKRFVHLLTTELCKCVQLCAVDVIDITLNGSLQGIWLTPSSLKRGAVNQGSKQEKNMNTFRRGISLIAGVGLLASVSACANPTQSGSGATPNEVGPEVENQIDEDLAAMVPEELRERGSFTVAINPDIAPVKFLDDSGEVAGLNPELLEAAGDLMDIEVEFQQQSFDALVPGLEAGRFDVIGSIGDFEERQEQIDFINYLTTGSALIVGADYEDDDLAEDDMCGMTLSYVRGTYQQGQIEDISAECTAEGNDAVEATGYGDANAALLSVESGQGDGFWGDLQQLNYNEKTNPDTYKVVANDTSGPYGIGVNKEDTEFRDALQAALIKLVENGTYDQTLEKWGQEDYGMPEMPLNTGTSMEG